MVPDDETIPPEPETQPDLAVFSCPACIDERGRPTGARLRTILTETGHRGRLEKCPVCKGRKQLNREEMLAYKQRPPEER
jgi:hypothetical protein